ncbi:MAG: hydrolase [Pseudonocardiales bacterium]|nr:hydrolase [Pseudonocardiales bacterium]
MALSQGTHSVMIGGLIQRYHVHGTGPVLFAHSGGPGLDWTYLRMPQVEQRLTIVYVEPVGTGNSGRLDDPTGYSYSRYSAQIEGLADHLGIEKVALLGHSSGGFVAQRFAIEYPDRVACLVLYDTSAVVNAEYYAHVSANVAAFPASHPGHDEAIADAIEAWNSQAAVSDDDGFTDIARRVFPLYFWDYWAQEERLAALRIQIRGWLAPQRAGGPVDDLAELSMIRPPVLIIVGRHDFICGPPWSQLMDDALPDSRVVVLERSGHFGHLEVPFEFAAPVVEFVVGASARTSVE